LPARRLVISRSSSRRVSGFSPDAAIFSAIRRSSRPSLDTAGFAMLPFFRDSGAVALAMTIFYRPIPMRLDWIRALLSLSSARLSNTTRIRDGDPFVWCLQSFDLTRTIPVVSRKSCSRFTEQHRPVAEEIMNAASEAHSQPGRALPVFPLI
jgi:hypothetical protein